MEITDFATPEIIGLLLAIVVPFGGAMIWLGTLRQRLKTLEANTGKMQDELRQLLIKFEADLLARRVEEERRKEEREENMRRDRGDKTHE
jgi:hypothetical protein